MNPMFSLAPLKSLRAFRKVCTLLLFILAASPSETEAASPLTWRGEVGGAFAGSWDIGSTPNWFNPDLGAPSVYVDGQAVQFDDSLTGTNYVLLSTSVAPNAITVINESFNYILTGSFGIEGGGTLLKQGSGALTIETPNTYSGGTVFEGGLLQIGHDNALGSGSVTVSGGTFATHNGPRKLPNPITITAGPTTFDTTAGDMALDGSLLCDAIDPTLIGGNQLFLRGGQTFTGGSGWNIYAGMLLVDGCTASTMNDGMRVRTTNELAAGLVITNDGSYTLGTGGGSGFHVRLGNAEGVGTNMLIIDSGAFIMGPAVSALIVGDVPNSIGAVYQKGGTIAWRDTRNLTGAGVTFAIQDGADGTYHLNGGTLMTPRVRQVSVGGLGRFFFNGGTLIPSTSTHSATFFQGISTAEILSGGAFIDTTNISITIGQALTGTGSLVKLGTASLTLSGASSYLGSTVVSNGTLLVNGSIDGNGVTVAPNGTLGGIGNIGGSVTNYGGSALLHELTSASGGGAQLTINGTLNLQGSSANKIVIRLRSMVDSTTPGPLADFNPDTPYTWIVANTGNGVLNFDPNHFVVDTSLFLNPIAGTFSVVVSGSSIAVVYTPETEAKALLVWRGEVNNLLSVYWDIDSTPNWLNADLGMPAVYSDGHPVLFNDSLTGTNYVLLNTSVAPSAVMVTNQAVNYTLAGSFGVGGGGTLLKQGSGTLTIATPNTYAGGTIFNEGILQVGHDDALGSGPLTISGGILATHEGARRLSNPVNIIAGAMAFDTTAGDMILDGFLLSDNNDPALLGGNQLFLRGGLTFTNGSGWNLYAGTLVVDGCDAVNNNDGVRFRTTNELTAGLVITNGGTYTVGTGDGSGIHVRLGNLAGTGANMLVIDSGELTLGPAASGLIVGDVSYSIGAVYQNGGTVAWQGTRNLSSAGVTLALTDGAEGTYYLNGGTLMTPRVRQVSVYGFGRFFFNGGTLIPSISTHSASFFQGVSTAEILSGGAFIDTTNINLTVGQSLAGIGNLVKLGTASLTLSGVSSYLGSTVVSNGTLVVNGSIGGSGVTVTPNGALGGTGYIGDSITNYGTITPGVNVGALTTGDQLWAGGSALLHDLTSANGSGDQLYINGTLNLQGSSANKIVIRLRSMADSTTPGPVADFDANTPYTWVVANAANGVLNFDPGHFLVDATLFANPVAGGFSVALSGTSLTVVYTPGALPPPEAAFTATPTSGPRQLLVEFSDSSTGEITDLHWQFGDGETVITAPGAAPTHLYVTEGTYEVTLTANGPGGSSSTQRQIVVTVPPSPHVASVEAVGSTINLAGTNGPALQGQAYSYVVYSSTDAALPRQEWTPVATNTFQTDGSFSISLSITPGEPKRFYMLSLP